MIDIDITVNGRKIESLEDLRSVTQILASYLKLAGVGNAPPQAVVTRPEPEPSRIPSNGNGHIKAIGRKRGGGRTTEQYAVTAMFTFPDGIFSASQLIGQMELDGWHTDSPHKGAIVGTILARRLDAEKIPDRPGYWQFTPDQAISYR